MHNRTFERAGFTVGALGLGCMGMTHGYGPHSRDEATSIEVIRRALDRGVNFIDTADVYGPFTNEELVGQALAGHRDRAVLATKVGLRQTPEGVQRCGRPDYIKASCDASLQRLRVEVIDLYQLHRLDPQVPIEDSVGAMADLVRAGKVRAIGLSEAKVPDLERADRVHPIASVQSELSLWTRDHVGDVLPWCRSHGVAFIAYSPLGRGYLTGRFQQRSDFEPDDWRLSNPRFSETAMAENRTLVEVVRTVSLATGSTPAQTALAWVLACGPQVIPIPGTRSPHRLDENLAATGVRLSADEVALLDRLPAPLGARYAP
jgi:aryl-alcohol dehydrogenase-like predicted oxidoreductase